MPQWGKGGTRTHEMPRPANTRTHTHIHAKDERDVTRHGKVNST